MRVGRAFAIGHGAQQRNPRFSKGILPYRGSTKQFLRELDVQGRSGPQQVSVQDIFGAQVGCLRHSGFSCIRHKSTPVNLTPSAHLCLPNARVLCRYIRLAGITNTQLNMESDGSLEAPDAVIAGNCKEMLLACYGLNFRTCTNHPIQFGYRRWSRWP